MYYIIMYYISKLFEMRFCYTVVFTSNYAQIPRPIISVNSSFLKPVCKGRQTRNFFSSFFKIPRRSSVRARGKLSNHLI